MSASPIVPWSMVVALSAALGATLFAQDAGEKPVDVSGTWKWQLPSPRGPRHITLTLKQVGQTLSGTIKGAQTDEVPIEEGSIKGDQVTFKVKREANGTVITTVYVATVTDAVLKGKSEVTTVRPFEARREQ